MVWGEDKASRSRRMTRAFLGTGRKTCCLATHLTSASPWGLRLKLQLSAAVVRTMVSMFGVLHACRNSGWTSDKRQPRSGAQKAASARVNRHGLRQVDSTQDAASRDLSCTTHKSVWHNNQHKIRSPCRTFRPTGKERWPYKAHVDTSDVACGSDGLDCCFVYGGLRSRHVGVPEKTQTSSSS